MRSWFEASAGSSRIRSMAGSLAANTVSSTSYTSNLLYSLSDYSRAHVSSFIVIRCEVGSVVRVAH